MTPRGITRIVETTAPQTEQDVELIEEMGDGIAAVYPQDGTCYVNKAKVQELKQQYQLTDRDTADMLFFILLHENAHLARGTADELEADRYAHEQYLKSGRSLQQSVLAQSRILRFDKPEDLVRLNAQYERAASKDQLRNYTGMKTKSPFVTPTVRKLMKIEGDYANQLDYQDYMSTQQTSGSNFNWGQLIGLADSVIDAFGNSNNPEGSNNGGVSFQVPPGYYYDTQTNTLRKMPEQNNNTMLIYGGIGLAVLVILVLVLKK